MSFEQWRTNGGKNGHGHIPLKVPNIEFFSMLGFWCICICWQHAAPNTCIKPLTSHLLAIIRSHNFNFNVRRLPISTLTSKTGAACCQQMHRVWCSVVSVISVVDKKWWDYRHQDSPKSQAGLRQACYFRRCHRGSSSAWPPRRWRRCKQSELFGKIRRIPWRSILVASHWNSKSFKTYFEIYVNLRLCWLLVILPPKFRP